MELKQRPWMLYSLTFSFCFVFGFGICGRLDLLHKRVLARQGKSRLGWLE